MVVCIGLLGCKHSIHRSATSYFLLSLTIVVILLGLRLLFYVVSFCLQHFRPTLTPSIDEEIEMQARAMAALHMQRVLYQQQQRRRLAAVAARSQPPPPPPQEEWQSKLVIAAGCDHVSFIAQPCPLRTATTSA